LRSLHSLSCRLTNFEPSVVAQDEWKDDLLVDAGLDFVLENIDDSFDDSIELVIDCVLENADDSLDDPIEKSSLLVAWPTSLMSSVMQSFVFRLF